MYATYLCHLCVFCAIFHTHQHHFHTQLTQTVNKTDHIQTDIFICKSKLEKACTQQSQLVSLLRFWCVVLGLGTEPQQEGNAQRWQSHDGEHQPVQLKKHHTNRISSSVNTVKPDYNNHSRNQPKVVVIDRWMLWTGFPSRQTSQLSLMLMYTIKRLKPSERDRDGERVLTDENQNS